MLQYKNALTPLVPANVAYIVIHHPAAVTATPEIIHQWHLDNGWSGAGYNEYIRKDGSIHIMRGDNVGAHCADSKRNYNNISYGICCEGNYDIETKMPQVQYDALLQRIRFNQAKYKNATIVPHRQLTSTTCPGKHFPWDKLINDLNFHPLKFGAKSDMVKKLQIILNEKGFSCGMVDGMFGAYTKNAVVKFQKQNNILADGIVGKDTWEKLNSK